MEVFTECMENIKPQLEVKASPCWRCDVPGSDRDSNRSKSFYKVQTDHSCRHGSSCLKSGGESAATEVSVISCIPGSSFHDGFLIFFCNIPPLFHNAFAVLILNNTGSVKTACTRVDQMDDTIVLFCNTFKIISCNSFNSICAPVCTNICKHLSTSGKEFHEQHSQDR